MTPARRARRNSPLEARHVTIRSESRVRAFTADAKKEATRDGALPIDLDEGDRLCELLKLYDVGVHTATRTPEETTVDSAFFAEHIALDALRPHRAGTVGVQSAGNPASRSMKGRPR